MTENSADQDSASAEAPTGEMGEASQYKSLATKAEINQQSVSEFYGKLADAAQQERILGLVPLLEAQADRPGQNFWNGDEPKDGLGGEASEEHFRDEIYKVIQRAASTLTEKRDSSGTLVKGKIGNEFDACLKDELLRLFSATGEPIVEKDEVEEDAVTEEKTRFHRTVYETAIPDVNLHVWRYNPHGSITNTDQDFENIWLSRRVD